MKTFKHIIKSRMNPFYYILIAGVCAGAYQILRKIVSSEINTLVAATFFSAVAAVVGFVFIYFNRHSLNIKQAILSKGMLWVLLGGLLVLPIDYFVIKAYGQNLPISLGVVMLVGLSAGMAMVFGLLTGESLSVIKVLALLLIVTGIVILKYQI